VNDADMTLAFLKSANETTSSARVELERLRTSNPQAVLRLLAHVVAVDAASGRLTDNPALTHASGYEGAPGEPTLYWWESQNVGIFYLHDGNDTVVVLLGKVTNPPFFEDLLTEAWERIRHGLHR
jgi:hypothetical protein